MGQAGQNAATRYGAGKELEIARRDSEACTLRAQGLTFDQIAKNMGYANRSVAFQACNRGYAAIRREGAEDLKTAAREQHDRLMSDLRGIIDTVHYAHNNGKLVLGTNGEPLIDNAPRLTAINTMIRLLERQAKREGLDAPTRQTLTVVTEDAVDAEIRRLEAELAEIQVPTEG
jgi:hypothetical protein